MPALIDKVQLTVWDQLVEFLSYEGWGNIVVISPYQQGRVLDLAHFLAQVVPMALLAKVMILSAFRRTLTVSYSSSTSSLVAILGS